MGEVKKDWSHVNEIGRRQAEKARSEMSPEDRAEAERYLEMAQNLHGQSEASRKEEVQNPQKIAEEKEKLDKIYEAPQAEESPVKTTQELIDEARERDKQMLVEAAAKESAWLERRKRMSPEEGLEEEQRQREAIDEQRKKDMDRIAKKFEHK